jgi:hypothetical protein
MADHKEIDLFGIPDTLVDPVVVSKQRTPRQNLTKKTEHTKKSTTGKSAVPSPPTPLPGQGFLPGLSRRGRPRLVKPISAVERTAEHRRKRIANGAKRVEIILDSDVSTALDRLAEHHQEPKSDVIASLIRRAATRLKK